MVKRYGRRVELTCKVVLAGDRSRYEGRVLDVSLPGCLIECVHALHVGDYVQLRLFFADQARPMDVSLAAVRWIDGKKIGVEFPFLEGRSGETGYTCSGASSFHRHRRSGKRDHRATPCYRPLITLRH